MRIITKPLSHTGVVHSQRVTVRKIRTWLDHTHEINTAQYMGRMITIRHESIMLTGLPLLRANACSPAATIGPDDALMTMRQGRRNCGPRYLIRALLSMVGTLESCTWGWGLRWWHPDNAVIAMGKYVKHLLGCTIMSPSLSHHPSMEGTRVLLLGNDSICRQPGFNFAN